MAQSGRSSFPLQENLPATCFPNANSSLSPVSVLLVPKKHFGNGSPDFVINAPFHGVDTRKQSAGKEL